MTGISENDGPPAPAPEAVEGIQSLHHRIDELHRLVAQRLEAEGVQAGSWLHSAAGVVHQRPTIFPS